jgi:hypothetical protein
MNHGGRILQDISNITVISAPCKVLREEITAKITKLQSKSHFYLDF